MVVRAERAGVVTYVDCQRILIDNADEYVLRKFVGLNERTCLNQKPIVKKGQRVKKGQILADGAADASGRTGPGPQRARRVHDLRRLQLRRRHRHQPAAGEGRHLHLDSHRGVRRRNPRDQARPRRVHPRHPERLASVPWPTSTRTASSASAPASGPATSSSARSLRSPRAN